MRNLIRRVLLRRSGDRGAIGVMVGVLVGFGVILGVGALVIDVGEIYVERAELQSGADAGALAVAKACVNTGTCDEGAADEYADGNATDGASAVDLVCGIGEGLSACPASSGGLVECDVDAPEGDYVEVRTSTRAEDGSTLLPPRLARAILGNEVHDGTTVHACARAVLWNAPMSGAGLALTISWCEWDRETDGGTDYAPPPPEEADPDDEVVLHFHQKASENPEGSVPCSYGESESGADLPGGFGWTTPEGESCTTDFNYDEETGDTTYDADPGTSVTDSKECVDAIEEAWSSRTPVIMPVYKGTPEGGGANGQYTLHEPVAFVVTGYYLGPVKKEVWLPGSPYFGEFPCGPKSPGEVSAGRDRCLSGYFTTATTSGDPGSGPGSGATVIRLTG